MIPGPIAPLIADDPDCMIRYELEPDGDGRLRLTHSGVGLKYLDTAPGWHTSLEALPGAQGAAA